MHKKLKFIDLFAGIGGFHLALKSQGMESVFTSEIDTYSRKTYAANFKEKYLEDSSHEIEVNKKLQCIKPNNILVMEDSFLDKKGNEFCIITKLLGKTINELIKDSKFNNPNWRYDTPVSSDLPKYNIP